jgi:protein-tyrosine phosphatase
MRCQAMAFGRTRRRVSEDEKVGEKQLGHFGVEFDSVIDLHTHILPGLDDGAKTIRDSLGMCVVAYRDGIRTIVATPHTLNGSYDNERSTILAKVQELNAAIKKELSFVGNKFPHGGTPALRILPGADVHLCEETLGQLDGGKVTTIADRGKHLLLEFPSYGIPYGAEDVLFQLRTRGIIPIISHPERNLEIGERPRRYYEMIRMGCLGQLTAMSLTGEFGLRVRRVAEHLLRKGFVHLIASDAHSVDGRAPVLSHAVRVAARIKGQREALRMVTEYPQAILEGRSPDVAVPIAPVRND